MAVFCLVQNAPVASREVARDQVNDKRINSQQLGGEGERVEHCDVEQLHLRKTEARPEVLILKKNLVSWRGAEGLKFVPT